MQRNSAKKREYIIDRGKTEKDNSKKKRNSKNTSSAMIKEIKLKQ
jgi:hypothetical protein